MSDESEVAAERWIEDAADGWIAAYEAAGGRFHKAERNGESVVMMSHPVSPFPPEVEALHENLKEELRYEVLERVQKRLGF